MADQEQGVSAPNPPSSHAQAGQQAQQPQQQQDNVALQVPAPTATWTASSTLKLVLH